jgi:hypothetical protein
MAMLVITRGYVHLFVENSVSPWIFPRNVCFAGDSEA